MVLCVSTAVRVGNEDEYNSVRISVWIGVMFLWIADLAAAALVNFYAAIEDQPVDQPGGSGPSLLAGAQVGLEEAEAVP